jgi:hypothetical protein
MIHIIQDVCSGVFYPMTLSLRDAVADAIACLPHNQLHGEFGNQNLANLLLSSVL